jgi:hypothetical protein
MTRLGNHGLVQVICDNPGRVGPGKVTPERMYYFCTGIIHPV